MGTIKTTVYLRSSDYVALKRLAAMDGRSAAALVREAVTEYTAHRASSLLPRSIGMASTGAPDWIERYEELMEGFGEDGPVRSKDVRVVARPGDAPTEFAEVGDGPAGVSGPDEASRLKCDEEIPGIRGKP